MQMISGGMGFIGLHTAKAFLDAGEDVVICGDWNTAHHEIDLTNWRSNRKNSGFTEAERALVDEYVDGGLS